MLPKPPNGYLPKDEALSLLRRFALGAEMDAPTRLPKRAHPDQVDEFLKDALSDLDKLKQRHVGQIGELMRFFDRRAQTPQIQKILARQERDLMAFLRSLSALGIVADLGDSAAQSKAAEYYQLLASHRFAPECWDGLVNTFFHLPQDADPKWISDPIEARMAALKPKIDADTKAAVEYYKLDDILKDRLPTVRAAKKLRHDFMELKSVPRRRQEVIRCYLRVEKNAYVDLRRWAVMVLQHDCNETAPSELAKEFEHMFRLIVDQAGRQGNMSADDKADLRKYTTTCARGVEFYGGQLDEDCTKFAADHCNNDQDDPLFWESDKPKNGDGDAGT